MSPRDHAADAGGAPDILEEKRVLREEVWSGLEEAGGSRFPGARGRIPNFVGAEAAAERLRGTEPWRGAGAVKANPDSPQWPVRQRALEDGMAVYMAVPRLAEPRPFRMLDPARLATSARKASSIKGSAEHGEPVAVEVIPQLDLVVLGCVAVDRSGARLGKGGGFADLEFAILQEAGLVTSATLVVTTVHPAQVVDAGRIPMTTHDVPVDLVITPDEAIPCDRGYPRPQGIHWADLTDEKVAAIPVLEALRT